MHNIFMKKNALLFYEYLTKGRKFYLFDCFVEFYSTVTDFAKFRG